MLNLIKGLLARRTSVTAAIIGLEKSIEKLVVAEKFHADEAERHAFIVDQATVDMKAHDLASARAARIRQKLGELLN